MSEEFNQQYFTEICEDGGSAFSFKINAKLHEEQTPYQHIAIYETTHFGNLMAIDGFNMLTSKDNFLYHEMMTHPVLFTHPAPKKVVIIGGGDCGTLQQVLLHQTVEQVTQIDIDERVTRLSEKYFPELCTSNQDPRATLLFDDGIKWIREAAAESVDVIIVDSTDPIGPGEVLFTEAFYQNCHRVLGKQGLFIQQSESPFYHQQIIQNMHNNLSQAGFAQKQLLHFPQPCYPTGWWSATLTSKQADLQQFREQAVADKDFTTEYYNVEIHRAALAQANFLKKILS